MPDETQVTDTTTTSVAQTSSAPDPTPAGAAPLPSAPGPSADSTSEPEVTAVLGGTLRVAGKVLGKFVVEELLDGESVDVDDFLPSGEDDVTKEANEIAFHKARVALAEIELDFDDGDVLTVKYLSGRTFVRVAQEAPAIAAVSPSAMGAAVPEERYAVVTVTHGSVHLDFVKQLAGPPPMGGAYPPGAVLRVATAQAKRLVASKVAKLGALKPVMTRAAQGNETVEKVSAWVPLDSK